MKKILLFLALASCTKVYAQDSIHAEIASPMTVPVAMDSAFGSLDTTRISTKYLLDRASMNFGPDKFNGLSGGSVDTIKNTFIFDQVYASVYLSQVSGHPHFTSPLVFASHADSICKLSRDTTVPVMMFMGGYNSIDTNAVRNGWISTTSHSIRLHDARLHIPYDTFGVFAAMSVREKLIGHNFYFQFNNDFFATNVPY